MAKPRPEAADVPPGDPRVGREAKGDYAGGSCHHSSEVTALFALFSGRHSNPIAVLRMPKRTLTLGTLHKSIFGKKCKTYFFLAPCLTFYLPNLGSRRAWYLENFPSLFICGKKLPCISPSSGGASTGHSLRVCTGGKLTHSQPAQRFLLCNLELTSLARRSYPSSPRPHPCLVPSACVSRASRSSVGGD